MGELNRGSEKNIGMEIPYLGEEGKSGKRAEGLRGQETQ